MVEHPSRSERSGIRGTGVVGNVPPVPVRSGSPRAVVADQRAAWVTERHPGDRRRSAAGQESQRHGETPCGILRARGACSDVPVGCRNARVTKQRLENPRHGAVFGENNASHNARGRGGAPAAALPDRGRGGCRAHRAGVPAAPQPGRVPAAGRAAAGGVPAGHPAAAVPGALGARGAATRGGRGLRRALGGDRAGTRLRHGGRAGTRGLGLGGVLCRSDRGSLRDDVRAAGDAPSDRIAAGALRPDGGGHRYPALGAGAAATAPDPPAPRRRPRGAGGHDGAAAARRSGEFLLLPVGFMVEEVFFRGALDTCLHRGEQGTGWLSAIFVSARGRRSRRGTSRPRSWGCWWPRSPSASRSPGGGARAAT